MGRFSDEPIFARVGGPPREAMVSLSFYGFGLNPDIITSALGLKPTRTRLPSESVEGVVSRASVGTGYWAHRVKVQAGLDIEGTIQALFHEASDNLVTWEFLSSEYYGRLFLYVLASEFNQGFGFFTRASERRHRSWPVH